MEKKRKLDESSSFLDSDENQVKKIKMDKDADDTSSSLCGQKERDDQPLEETDSPIIITTTNSEDNFNPLTNNDTVLPKILSLLPLPDLKAARCVSRRWNQISAKYFQAFCSVAQICFYETRYAHGPWARRGHIPHGIGDMADFTQDVQTRGTSSFRRFYLGQCILRNEGSTSTVTDFLSVCGPYIEELSVGRVDEQMKVMYEQVLLPSSLTSLRVLRVNVWLSLRKAYGAFLDGFFDFVGKIIQVSTNLERFALFLDESLSEGQVTNCLIPSLSLCNFDKLVNLDIHAALTSGHFIALSRIQGLRLKRLEFILWRSIEDPGPFQQFLEGQSGSLESLKLAGSYGYVVEFPRMNCLKSLELDDSCYGCMNPGYSFTFPDLSYPQQFPSLETLIVPHPFTELDDQLVRADLRPCLTLQELVVSGTFEDKMSIAVSLFPNLKKLDVPWDTVTQAYSLLPYLEELTFGSGVGNYRGARIDELITGIPNAECERIPHEGNYEAVLGNFEEIQTTPSITSLKRLKTLKLNVIKENDDTSFIRITEASFHLALFHMESLETLDFGSTDLTQIPSECMEAIRRRFRIKTKPI